MPHKRPFVARTALYLESASDYRIILQVGRKAPRTITLVEARAMWEGRDVDDWNAAFQRLADNNFDIESVKAHYAGKQVA